MAEYAESTPLLPGGPRRKVYITDAALVARESTVVNIWTRVLEDMCSNPGLAILIRLPTASRNHSRRMLGRFPTAGHNRFLHHSDSAKHLAPPILTLLSTRCSECPLECLNHCNLHTFRAAVSKRLAGLHPTKAIRVQSPTGSFPDFCNSGIMPDDAAGWRGSPVSPLLHSGAGAFSPHSTPIGSQDLVVKSRSNLSTQLHSITHMLPKQCSGDVVARLLVSHIGELGSIPGGVVPRLSHVGNMPDDTAGLWVFSRISRLPRPSSETSTALNIELLRADDGEVSPGIKGREKREIPKTTRRPSASPSTIPTFGNQEWPGRGLNPDSLGGRRAVETLEHVKLAGGFMRKGRSLIWSKDIPQRCKKSTVDAASRSCNPIWPQTFSMAERPRELAGQGSMLTSRRQAKEIPVMCEAEHFKAVKWGLHAAPGMGAHMGAEITGRIDGSPRFLQSPPVGYGNRTK
ncbi:hypothetical protein PR048_011869 [Dryococelus australis]|uniref:Uncharacterized protein n=1 Tax=Dryococelus australis TaxID=614101 RepID=A0ABQ9HMU9_9NEOP|nr:hypothetical protein PR048_011869 [Dryococelus australis]